MVDRPRRRIRSRQTEHELLADAIVNLLHAVVIPAASRLDVRALSRAMCADVDDHLTDPELGPAKIASVHHVSVRQVHNVFANHDDSPGPHIRRRRLELARTMLQNDCPVAMTGYRSSFSNPDTFTRAFKRQFGENQSTLPH